MFGAVIGRAEAQVMRLACIYALLDYSDVVRKAHLEAALALEAYAEDSALLIFGDKQGDATADEISRALLQHPEGMTRTTINALFGRNRKADEITRALDVLLQAGKARRVDEQTGGRPAERWFATTK